jgi:hypothetical protein
MHTTTASITRTATGVTSTAPHPVQAPARPGWTMPIALLAFTAVLLLTGLTALKRQAGRAAAVQSEVATHAAQVLEAPPPAAVAIAPSTATTQAHPAVAPPPALPAHAAVHVPATQRPVAHATASRGGRSAPAAPTPPSAPPPAAAPVAPAAPPAPAAAAPAVKPGCESPFAIGADGIRQIKPECM